MKQIGSFMTSVYREESKSMCAHTEAMCKASPQFLPIVLDKTGYRAGKEYRYASIHSIRRATQTALSANGLRLSHIYGHSDEGTHVTTVLRHISGEFESSTLRVPPRSDLQELKATKTMLCRIATEGLLAICCEDDDDAQCLVQIDADAANVLLAQAHSLEMAGRAIAAAESAKALDGYLTLAAQRIAEGVLAADALTEINQRVAMRRAQLGGGDDRDNGIVGNEGKDADGGGSGSNAGGSGRTPKSGRGNVSASDARAGATA